MKSYTKDGQRQKSYGHIHENSIEDTVSFIQKLQKEYPISRLCKVLRFARSTYYEVSVRVPSKRQREHAEFAAAVRDYFYESKQRYGTVKLHRILGGRTATPTVSSGYSVIWLLKICVR